jgi:hypothetical protein
MNNVLLTVGAACVVLAIVGGGGKVVGVELPYTESCGGWWHCPGGVRLPRRRVCDTGGKQPDRKRRSRRGGGAPTGVVSACREYW